MDADVVQHQAVALCEADLQFPVVPAHVVAVDFEARTVRLGNRDFPEVSALLAAPDRSRIGRDRHYAEIVDSNDFARGEIEHRVQVGDRARVRVVTGIVHQPAVSISDPSVLLLRVTEITRRPALDQHARGVFQAASCQRLQKALVPARQFAGHHEFVGHDARLRAFHLLPVA